MALIGVVDPSHDERAADGAGRLPAWLDLEEVMRRAASADPSWSPWPYELLNAALSGYQERDYISTTMLTGGCARGKVMERREDYILPVDALYAALRGTLLHRALEYAARPYSVAEARFFTTVEVPKAGPTEVSCSPDIITADGQLGDWKMTEHPPAFQYPWRDHTLQVNLNRYIVNHAERWVLPDSITDLPWDPRTLRFRSLFLCYLGPKGPKVMECLKKQPFTFKNGNEGMRNLPYIMSDGEVEDWFYPALEGMVKALAAYPDWPEGLEEYPGFEGPVGWACPGKPLCSLPDCLAKRRVLKWENE